MFIIPFMVPMLLGRTYDYNSARVGVDIFDRQTLKTGTIQIDRYSTDANFRLIKTTRDVDDLLDVKGELSLKVMADLVNVDGSGSYIKDNQDKENIVELLCRVKYETITNTLETSARPTTQWSKFPKDVLGTHFVRSVTYGGELVASLKFKATSKKNAQIVEAALSAGLGIQGTLDLSVGGQLKKVRENLDSSVHLEIKYYATVPVHGVPQNLEGLQTLISGFDKHVKEVGGGKGNPIRVELFPLSSLGQGLHIVTFIRDSAIGSKLEEVQTKYKDVLTAYKEMTAWGTKLGRLPDAIRTQIGTFNNELTSVKDAFYLAVADLDISKLGDRNQFTACIASYRGADGFDIPGKYMRRFKQLKEDVDLALSGLGRCDFAPPLVNSGVLRANVVNTGGSTAVSGAVSINFCKQQCKKNKRCQSITYYKKTGSPDTRNTDDRCYLNFVSLANNRLIPVPHKGTNDILIYVKNTTKLCRKK